jgi:hypothetical protein
MTGAFIETVMAIRHCRPVAPGAFSRGFGKCLVNEQTTSPGGEKLEGIKNTEGA